MRSIVNQVVCPTGLDDVNNDFSRKGHREEAKRTFELADSSSRMYDECSDDNEEQQ